MRTDLKRCIAILLASFDARPNAPRVKRNPGERIDQMQAMHCLHRCYLSTPALRAFRADGAAIVRPDHLREPECRCRSVSAAAPQYRERTARRRIDEAHDARDLLVANGAFGDDCREIRIAHDREDRIDRVHLDRNLRLQVTAREEARSEEHT